MRLVRLRGQQVHADALTPRSNPDGVTTPRRIYSRRLPGRHFVLLRAICIYVYVCAHLTNKQAHQRKDDGKYNPRLYLE